MTLNIISAVETLFSGEVTSVTLPGTMGEFTVLHNHAALLSTLTVGTIRYTDADGQEMAAEIPGGVADIDRNVISVCVY